MERETRIRQEHLALIQNCIDELNVPFGVGRIPYKVGSNFAGMTADQWMNWTNIYSLYALHDVLPAVDLKCWSLFVQASILLRQYSISQADLNDARSETIRILYSF